MQYGIIKDINYEVCMYKVNLRPINGGCCIKNDTQGVF